MGHELMPGSEEHALAGMATVINPSATAKPIGTIMDPPASFKVASSTAAPMGSGTKTTRRRRRPNESYSNIIIKAIRNSPHQRLKLSDIYDFVSREIPQMNGDDKGWQNTVRHNLSHNKCFRRVVIKSTLLGSGSADEKDESKQQTPPPLVLLPPSSSSSSKEESNDPAQVFEYATKGKGGYWVLVPEFLEEAMSSSRPKKSLADVSTLRQAATTTATATATVTTTATTTAAAAVAAKVSGTLSSTVVAISTTSSGAGPISRDQSSSTAMDIDLDVASMAIAGQQQQQQTHGLGRFRGVEDESMTSTSGDENELESEQSDGQSEHSLLSLKSSHNSIRSSSGSEFDELEEDDDDEEEEEEDGDREGTSARRAMSIQDMLN
ncbi:hypothetical protein BGZ70_007080 [Mortierella alpina]|uniref:Fork-head domain-containing protein n=1 Tax=Mortierella alpina TaxID=64518 RepID=A0A9P6M387_MORAP|nr:hypothetical protein BGZ70_007080 [Mortierella alpina]